MFKLHWLHIMDLGVAADVAGNVLCLLQGKMCCAIVKARARQLHLEIATDYNELKDRITPHGNFFQRIRKRRRSSIGKDGMEIKVGNVCVCVCVNVCVCELCVSDLFVYVNLRCESCV